MPEARPQHDSAGSQKLLNYLQQIPKPDALYVSNMLRQNPDDVNAMMTMLQSRVGNDFVQQVLAAGKTLDQRPTSGKSSPTAAVPAPMVDGTVVDGGELGKIVSSSATTGADVTVARAEAVVTAVQAGNALLKITAAIPLSDIHANDVTPEMLSQITNVTLVGGLGGTLGYQVSGGILQLTLTGVTSVKALKLGRYKLWLDGGTTVLLKITSGAFRLEDSELNRVETRQEIAGEQQSSDMYQSQLAKMQKQPGTNGTMATQVQNDAMGYTQDIAREQTLIAAAEKKLAAEQAPDYVMLDSDGMPARGPQ